MLFMFMTVDIYGILQLESWAIFDWNFSWRNRHLMIQRCIHQILDSLKTAQPKFDKQIQHILTQCKVGWKRYSTLAEKITVVDMFSLIALQKGFIFESQVYILLHEVLTAQQATMTMFDKCKDYWLTMIQQGYNIQGLVHTTEQSGLVHRSRTKLCIAVISWNSICVAGAAVVSACRNSKHIDPNDSYCCI